MTEIDDLKVSERLRLDRSPWKHETATIAGKNDISFISSWKGGKRVLVHQIFSDFFTK